jgi:hypothetical protein
MFPPDAASAAEITSRDMTPHKRSSVSAEKSPGRRQRIGKRTIGLSPLLFVDANRSVEVNVQRSELIPQC